MDLRFPELVLLHVAPGLYRVAEKGSRRASARLRALFNSGLAHELFTQSRLKSSFETSSDECHPLPCSDEYNPCPCCS